MDDRSSLDRLRGDLRRRGLPHEYVERVVGELDDHKADLEEEGRRQGLAPENAGASAADRLGPPSRLADAVVEHFRRRSFLGRHPILTFLVAPAVLTLLAWAVCDAVVAPLCFALGATVASPTTLGAINGLCRALRLACWFVPPAAITVVAGRLARTTGRGRAWQVLACVSVTVLGAFVRSELTVLPEGHGTWTIGVSPVPQLWALTVPLAAAALQSRLSRPLAAKARA
jgi:hypothetical protein